MLIHLSNMCSHLQNASRARLGLTSLPSTKHTLALSLALQSSGFLSTVIRGGPDPPQILTPTSLPSASSPEGIADATLTQSNIASRRLWVGLKYWNQHPVLRGLRMESTPKKGVRLGWREIARVVRGDEVGFVKGLGRTGECLFLLTDRGLLESRVAVEEGVGGLVLCRVF